MEITFTDDNGKRQVSRLGKISDCALTVFTRNDLAPSPDPGLTTTPRAAAVQIQAVGPDGKFAVFAVEIELTPAGIPRCNVSTLSTAAQKSYASASVASAWEFC